MKSKLIIIGLILGGLFFLWTGFLWKVFKSNIAGSYPHVETWNFKVKESDLIHIINEIKIEHPELEPPNVSYPTSEKNGYWYEFTFYYDDTKQNVYTWTRANEDSLYTTFAFIAIASHIDALTPVNKMKMDRREINSDFGYFENRREIKKFENRIVKLIEQKISNN